MEIATSHRTMEVTESSQPSAARSLARELAESAGFGGDDVHRAGIVATELATNLVKHADRGEFLARLTASPPDGEIELIAIDRGPGMRDVTACLADGHSTAGSSGTGLGAIRRLGDTFDIHSEQRGTVVLARLRGQRRAPDQTGIFDYGAVSVAKTGEEHCGDAWTARREAERLTLMVADGLGHGFLAAQAAEAALHGFRMRRYSGNAEALEAIHNGMRHTRGAAAAIAEIHHDLMLVRYAGIGNISAAVCHNSSVRQAVSHNGTLGHQVRVIREYAYPWFDDGVIVMHSDGLGSHWSLDEYRGLRQRHPAVIAAVLYRDHSRGRDDVTVVVAKEAR